MYYCVRTILLFAIFSLSTGIGILISKMYENRVKELRQFKNILNIIKTKIKFTYEPLAEIFNQISQEKSSKIEEIFENMTYKLASENIKYSWMDAIQEADISITQEDKDILKELGKVLGQTDADSQVNEIEVTESFLNMQIEKAEEAITEEEAEKLEAQLRKNKFDLDDYLTQLRQIKKMGSFSSILKMIPGLGSKMKDIQVDDKEFLRIESMICSMTKEERRNPKILNGQRRLRIAKGSGTTVEQLNKFMKSFEMTQKMMKQMKSEKGMKNVMRNLKGIDKDAFKDLKTRW